MNSETPFPSKIQDLGPRIYNAGPRDRSRLFHAEPDALEASKSFPYGFPASKSFQFMIALNPIAYVPCDCQRQNGRIANMTT